MRILIFGSTDSPDHRRLAVAARAQGVQLRIANLADVTLRVDEKGTCTLLRGHRIVTTFDAIMFRRVNPHISTALTLAAEAHAAGLRVTDRGLANGVYVNSKAHDAAQLAAKGVAVVPTVHPGSRADARKHLNRARYPLIAKGIHGSHGEHVHLCQSKGAAQNIVRDYDEGTLMFQPFIDVHDEFRVLVLDGAILGVVRKTAAPDDFRRNATRGATFQPATLPHDVRRMCIRAAKITRHDFAGIDVSIDEQGRSAILEVNATPGFVTLEAATGIDVAAQVIRWLKK